MFISLRHSHIALPEFLHDRMKLNHCLPTILSKAECANLYKENSDFLPLSKLSKNVVMTTEESKNFQKDCISANDAFDNLTDRVFRFNSSTRHETTIDILYKNDIRNLFKTKDLFGIVARDEITGEIINFTHPFRALHLIHSNRKIRVSCYYIYKNNDTFIDDEYDPTYLEYYVRLYKMELLNRDKMSLENRTYITFNKETSMFQVYSSNKCNFSKYLNFSDILVKNSFIPHYAIFPLFIEYESLYSRQLRGIMTLTPNISYSGSVCTGNLPNISIEGFECLKISNLLSPFSVLIYHKTQTLPYVQYCIKLARSIYESEN